MAKETLGLVVADGLAFVDLDNALDPDDEPGKREADHEQ